MKRFFKEHTEKIYLYAVIVTLAALVLVMGIAVSYDPSAPAEKQIGERRDGVYNCLVLGKDEAAGLTDVIFIASVDVNGGNISIVQIPRDTYLAYTEKDYKKLNGAYRSLGGAKELSKYLSDALSIEIDFYVSLSLLAVADMVDRVGGVTVNVPRDMDYDDPSQNLSIHLKAGEQKLDGKSALGFIRYRSGYVSGDIGRIDAQKIFLSAFFNHLKNEVSLSSLVGIATYMLGRVETNASLYDCIYFAKALASIDGSDVRMLTIPGSEVRSDVSGAWYYVISKKGALDAINKHLNVYQNDIKNTEFDKSHLFSDREMRSYEAIYNSDIKIKEYTATSIIKGGIEILS